MRVLVTGGAGFIGRWVVKKLLADGHHVSVLDNLSNGRLENISETKDAISLTIGDIRNQDILMQLFNDNKFDICYHLAAKINVQDSLDDAKDTFHNDVVGTFNVLEECRKHSTKMVFMSTCMVYDRATNISGINENSPIKPASPYAGSKIAGENLVLSYFYGYGLPTVVIRPFNTYGPFQKSSGEGGVVAIFIKRQLEGNTLNIYGSGTQTRDLLYVEDCARFVVEAGYSDKVNGEVVNAGLGSDITVNDLAAKICPDPDRIKHVDHIHPQSEIPKLLCDYKKAREILNWQPRFSLDEGIKLTEIWIKAQMEAE